MTEHSYIDPDGNPIPLLDWARRFEDISGRTLVQDAVSGDRTIRTLYHGFVFPTLAVRPFGTALFGPDGEFEVELETYDDKATALRRHAAYVEEYNRQSD